MVITPIKEIPMSLITLPTIDTAPEASRPTMQALRENFGFLPNVLATMGANPVLLNGFAGAFSAYHGGGFDECERQVLLLTNAVTLRCPWTIAAHSTFALEDGLTVQEVDDLRAGRLPANPRYAALSQLARLILEKHGVISDREITAFTAAGFVKEQVFEVILSVGLSTMTAATTNLARTPIEDHFMAQVPSAA